MLNCHIVQDLLPNYIEHVTDKQTDTEIEEHLAGCENCRSVLDNMKRFVEPQETVDLKECKDHLKKLRRRGIRKGAVWAAAVCTVIFGLIIGLQSLFYGLDIPIAADKIRLEELYQSPDGRIWADLTTVSGVEYHGTITQLDEDGNRIITFYQNLKMALFPQEGQETLDFRSSVDPGETGKIYYQGKNEEDRLLIWETGMQLPIKEPPAEQ